MSIQKILTIAIPTYNRAHLLIKTLESVIKQKTDEIEIIVSDNASTDNTQELMIEYENKGIIKYYRNKHNLGMDRNFLNCICKSHGQYIHLLSDDDMLLDGAIEKILQIIEKQSPDYIHLNSVTYDKKKYNTKFKMASRINIKKDFISECKEEYMKYIGIHITFLSASVIKRDNLKNIQVKKYIGTYFLHAHIILNTLKGNNKKVVITQEPLIASKANNSGGYNLYQVWVREYKKLLLVTGVKSGFDYEKMLCQYRTDMKGIIRNFILNFRINKNEFDLKQKYILVTETYRYLDIVFRTWPVAFLPKSIIKILFSK